MPARQQTRVETERERLLRRCARDRDRRDLERLVLAYRSLARSLARRFP